MLSFLFWLLFFIWVIASAVLVLVVLVQSGKGGGLSGLVGAGSSLGDSLGATGAERTLNRWTTYCAIAFMGITILLGVIGPHIYGTLLDEARSSSALVNETTPAEGAAADATATPAADATATPAAGAAEAPASSEAPAPDAAGGAAEPVAQPPVAQPDAPATQ